MVKRFLSAIVLCLIFIPLIVGGGIPFLIGIAVLAILSLKEMLDLRISHGKFSSGIELLAILVLLFLIFYEFAVHDIGGISLTCIAGMCLVFLIPTLYEHKNCDYNTHDAFYIIGVLLLLGSAFYGIVFVRNLSLNVLIYLFLIAICTDVFAYLIGSKFGKRKIFPTISPNKTYAGSLSGIIFGTIIPSIFYYLVIGHDDILFIILTSFVLSIITEVGDLLFSKIKRENKIKDFSDLIPGHGGILDRLDSIIFVVLAFMIIIRFI